jgi:methylated-DNA-[protein]-cysteine S-methyltransferase
MTHHTIMDSPVGPLTLVERDGGLAGIYMVEHRHMPDPATFGDRDDDAAPLPLARRQLAEYFAGDRTEFDLPLNLTRGTPFQQRVWAALLEIPYGGTTSYGELAGRIGAPGAARAVGLANGRNPVSIVVPCHRVVGSTGSLTGYGGGIETKRRLLAAERGETLF